MSTSPTLYFDLASPYAYLAVARADSVLPNLPRLQPILLGAIFKLRGGGSWAHTPSREPQMAEVEARSERYGLPAMAWPEGWPMNSLAAMRAATWAEGEGCLREFAHAVYRAEFARGEDPSQLEVLEACGEEAGMEGERLRKGIQDPDIKEKLRAATEAAWAAGVRGVPTLIAEGVVYYGDDQLGGAAKRLRS
jgi:2-hydroxychromene-2-carboxylate isomerase